MLNENVMKLDLKGLAVSFAVALAGLALGLWQVAALAGLLGGLVARERPVRSATLGTLAAWGLVLLYNLAATPAGRVAGALGSALGLPGGLPFVLGSLGVAAALAALGAVVGGGLRPVLSTKKAA